MLIIFVLTALVSGIGVWLVMRIAMKRSILDVPNERSSHTVPTPRGGGVAIAFTLLAAVFILRLADPVLISQKWVYAICGGGLVIAVIGWLDDCYSLPASLRFGVHFLAAAWAVWWLYPAGMPVTPHVDVPLAAGSGDTSIN